MSTDKTHDTLMDFADRGVRAQQAAAQAAFENIVGPAPDHDAVLAGVALALRSIGLTMLANEIEHGCLRLAPGEPFFVLRGQDVSASGLVRMWANQNAGSCPDETKIDAALRIADAMAGWPKKKTAD